MSAESQQTSASPEEGGMDHSVQLDGPGMGLLRKPSRWSLWLVGLFLCLSWSSAEAKPKKKRGKKGRKGKKRKKPETPAPTPDPEPASTPAPSKEEPADDPADREKPRGPDKVTAGEAVPVHEGPGDGFKSKRKIDGGTAVNVVQRSGRWAKISAGRTQGWILERSLESYEPRSGSAETPEETPSKKTWGGEGAELSLDEKTSFASAGFALSGGQLLGEKSSERVTRKREPLPRFGVRSSLGIGYRSLSMDFSSAGDGALANTIVETQAMTAAGSGELVLRSASRRMHLALDSRVRLSYSNPGIEVRRSGDVLGDVDFSIFEAQGGVRAGMALGRDFELGLRGGLRYDVFYTSSVDNPGLLPRESLLGFTAGGRLDWLRFLPDVVVALEVEALVSAKRKQTPGLKDGSDASVRGAWVGLQSQYRISPQLDIFAAFLYGWVRSEWTGPSERNPDVMQSSRTDSTQTIQFGLAHRF